MTCYLEMCHSIRSRNHRNRKVLPLTFGERERERNPFPVTFYESL